MGHGFAHRFPPLTLCSYEVDVEDVVDLRTDADRAREGVALAELGCAWALDMSNGIESASWGVARRMIDGGAAGIVVPSFARRATAGTHNLVLWKWGPDLPHKVVAHDPSGRLRKDQASWS
jgi:RES domain-containing protein